MPNDDKPETSRERTTETRRADKNWKRYFRTTREGKAFILVTGGVGFAAINTGNNLLFLIFGFMLSLIVLSGIMSEIVLRRLRIERRLPHRAFAGSTCLIEIALRNDKARAPSYSLEVEDIADKLPTERRCYFLKVAAKTEQVAGYRRVPPARGVLKLAGFRVATRYPFGIIEKWRVLPAPQELLVYPALLSEPELAAQLRSVGAETASARIGAGSEVAGLRGHQHGDEARSIHWRRSAALGRLVVLEKHSDRSSHMTIVLDNARPDALSPEAGVAWDHGFELAISRAASIAVCATQRDLTVDVACRAQRSPAVLAGNPADPILRFLARLQSVPASEAEPLPQPVHGVQRVEIPVVPVRSAA